MNVTRKISVFIECITHQSLIIVAKHSINIASSEFKIKTSVESVTGRSAITLY